MNPGAGAPAGSYAYPNWALERRVSDLETDISRMKDDIHVIRWAVEDMHRDWRYAPRYAPPGPHLGPVVENPDPGQRGWWDQIVQRQAATESRLKQVEQALEQQTKVIKELNDKLDRLPNRPSDKGSASLPSPENAAPAHSDAPEEAAAKEAGPAESKKP